MRPWAAAVLLAVAPLFAIAERLDTGEPVIVVDLAEGDVLEIELNSLERPTLLVQARHGASPVPARFDVLGATFDARELLLQFYPCRKDAAKIVQDEEGEHHVVLPTCQAAIKSQGESRATIVSPPRSIAVNVSATVEGEPLQRVLKIELNRRHFDLGWSGGYMVSDHRDERYRLVEREDGMRSAVELDEASSRRSFLAMGTISLVRAPLVGLSFGVGTANADFDNLAVLVGGTFTFRMRRAVDAVLLTTGLSYGPTLTLKPEYRGGTSIPDDLEAADVVENEHELAPFVAISFRRSGDGGLRKSLGGD